MSYVISPCGSSCDVARGRILGELGVILETGGGFTHRRGGAPQLTTSLSRYKGVLDPLHTDVSSEVAGEGRLRG